MNSIEHQPPSLAELSVADAAMDDAVRKAQRIVGKNIPLLILGESGVGKELFAKAFHRSGRRAQGPFVALNCGALPETLIDAELFGYADGAFTGARKDGALGKIQQANHGTLFLDEIGDMPPHLQTRLLRVLQERYVVPLGATQAMPVDISLVCATHRDLPGEVAQGRFRQDLYYRLNGLCVRLPSLRERSDIRVLVAQLLASESGGRPPAVSAEAMALIEAYAWPGNIRQLQSALRVAVALVDAAQPLIEPQHLPQELLDGAGLMPDAAASAALDKLLLQAWMQSNATLKSLEQEAIALTLESVSGNISAAARRLGITRNTLYNKLGRLSEV